jgi:IS30 family transposase
MGSYYEQLSLEERYAIADRRADGQSLRQIAAALDRSASTIARELNRNTGAQVGYRPAYADAQAWARRWRGSRMARQPALRRHVLDRLAMGWSPEQVAGRLALEPSSMRISHESIYRFIEAQIRRTKDYSWRYYLPRKKTKRGWRRRPHRLVGLIKDRVGIDCRPAHIASRRQCGHWEADLIHPRKSGAAILVAQERQTRYVRLAKQAGKHAQPIVNRLKLWFAELPPPLRRSLTQDNGPEFFEHHQLNPLGIKTYFCHPHSPWQKGGIENMNGRIRRYIPRGTDPQSFSDADLQELAQRLNHTPRKCLGFKTPAEAFHIQLLHFKCESTFPPSRG